MVAPLLSRERQSGCVSSRQPQQLLRVCHQQLHWLRFWNQRLVTTALILFMSFVTKTEKWLFWLFVLCFICGKIKLPISLKQCGFLNLSLYKSQYPSAAVSYHAMNPQLSWRPDAGASTNILFLSFCPYSLITAWALFTHRRRTAREWVCETRCTRLQT